MTAPQTPHVLVAASGFDPGCGAGLARDILSAAALGVPVIAVGTAWADQPPAGAPGAVRIDGRAAAAIGEALREALTRAAGAGAAALKIGMVGTPAVADAILDAAADFSGPIVVDPVLTATSGVPLFDGEPARLLALARRATLLTPNLDEAARLTRRRVDTLADAMAAAQALVEAGVPAVLVKGGHLPGEAVDVLATREGITCLGAPRVPGRSPRGTGCALACAIAIELLSGRSLPGAVTAARAWLRTQIEGAVAVGSDLHLRGPAFQQSHGS